MMNVYDLEYIEMKAQGFSICYSFTKCMDEIVL